MAVLEGDDYWCDPFKLQKQFDAMEANPTWSMCFSRCRVFYEGSKQPERMKPDVEPTGPLSVDDFLYENAIQTMSVAMFRQGVVEKTPAWHASLRLGDWALNILHAYAGPVGFVPGTMTCYRVHDSGQWSGYPTFLRNLEVLSLFSLLEQHYREQVGDRIAATKFLEAKSQHTKNFADRVAYLEKVERRYQLLQLEKVAGLCAWLKRRLL